MKDLFYDDLLLVENANSRFNNDLADAIVSYTESLSDHGYITESEQKTLWVKVKEWFSDLIASFKTFQNNIKIKLRVSVTDAGLEVKLRMQKKKLESEKASGMKKIQTIDLIKYKDTYLKMTKQLWSYAKKFERVRYKTVEQVDSDLEDFNILLNQFEEKLKKIEEKKIKVPIDTAITFVENEISGTSDVMQTINDSITMLEDMKSQAEILTNKRNILGVDVIPRHISLIKRVANSITSFVRRHAAKFISTVVFLFA